MRVRFSPIALVIFCYYLKGFRTVTVATMTPRNAAMYREQTGGTLDSAILEYVTARVSAFVIPFSDIARDLCLTRTATRRSVVRLVGVTDGLEIADFWDSTKPNACYWATQSTPPAVDSVPVVDSVEDLDPLKPLASWNDWSRIAEAEAYEQADDMEREAYIKSAKGRREASEWRAGYYGDMEIEIGSHRAGVVSNNTIRAWNAGNWTGDNHHGSAWRGTRASFVKFAAEEHCEALIRLGWYFFTIEEAKSYYLKYGDWPILGSVNEWGPAPSDIYGEWQEARAKEEHARDRAAKRGYVKIRPRKWAA